MLSVRLDADQQGIFLDTYRSTNSDPDALWSSLADRGFDERTINALQTDAVLGELTRQNAPVVGRLVERTGLGDAAELADLGFYRAAAWRDVVGDDVPEGLTVEQYTSGLAAQVATRFPARVTADLVRSNAVAVAPEAKDEVAAFFAQRGANASLGVAPVRTWEGFADLSAGAREGALKVERLFQISPSNDAMVTLSSLGIDSALQVMRYSPTGFVAAFGDKFPSTMEARLTYTKAQQVHTTALTIATQYLAYRGAPNVYGITGRLTRQAPESGTRRSSRRRPSRTCSAAWTTAPATTAGRCSAPPHTSSSCSSSSTSPTSRTRSTTRSTCCSRAARTCSTSACPARTPTSRCPTSTSSSRSSSTGSSTARSSASRATTPGPTPRRPTCWPTRSSSWTPRTTRRRPRCSRRRCRSMRRSRTCAHCSRSGTRPCRPRSTCSAHRPDARREWLGLNAAELSLLTDVGFRALPEYFGEPAATTLAALNGDRRQREDVQPAHRRHVRRARGPAAVAVRQPGVGAGAAAGGAARLDRARSRSGSTARCPTASSSTCCRTTSTRRRTAATCSRGSTRTATSSWARSRSRT